MSQEEQHLRQARVGSHRAFRALVEPHREELRRHCYRMTGSVDDADDIVQETLFRAWRGLGSYVSRGSFRAWLYRIATNRTLDLLASAPRRREVVNSASEPAWLQPYPTALDAEEQMLGLEAIGLAFVVALQRLPARQRSALLLADVLGFTARETAELMGVTPAAVNSLLQRARVSLAPAQSDEQPPQQVGDARALVDRFVKAWRRGDRTGMLALLDDDSLLTMPPHELEFRGATNVVDLLLDETRFAHHTSIEFMELQANGVPGFATYTHGRRHCLMFFRVPHERATKITGFTDDATFALFDLPMHR